ncbi:MAG: DUF4019 domain-containing protein [Betaproteobacteria bacterium]|nr:DUF4019 domain-containing protein [Betaproteobacteria bacterium]MCC7217124.1 DUF4019 domain-containing protein [Burkholderiales bacterium]
MGNSSIGRRAALAALLTSALAWTLPAAAQDPRATEAQAAALAWLALADANDAAATWRQSSARFREAITQDAWAASLKSARGKFGAALQRAKVGVQPPGPGKGTPPGEFLVVVFRTEFALKPQGVETLTMEREADGKWRVVGYLIR